MNLVGGIVIAFERAFEMGDEGRTLDGQVVVLFHGLRSLILGTEFCSRLVKLAFEPRHALPCLSFGRIRRVINSTIGTRRLPLVFISARRPRCDGTPLPSI